jgi:hypothetical protein
MPRTQIAIRLGALSPPIAKQLRQQGVSAKPADVKAWQKDADCITRLHVRGYIHDSTADSARRKLVNAVCRAAVKEPTT